MALFKKRPVADPGGDGAPTAGPKVQWDLGHLVGRVRDAAPALEARDVEAALVQARLADHYRDVGLAPPDAAEVEGRARDLDLEGWRRLALAVAALDDAGLRSALAELAPAVPVTVQVESGFLGLARDTAPLTVALVRQSAVRAEEFARHFAMQLGVAILGETATESRERLHALDYKRLLAEAEQAKAAAHEKMERLRRRQAEADRRTRRGKW
jgi:hypothetical protein